VTEARGSEKDRVTKTISLSFLLVLVVPAVASAQPLPACTGTDAAAAAAEFEAGNALMEQAMHEARRRLERAREIAGEALQHFDRQCELGDEGALAERGAALMLMGEPLRSAQSYDAYLAVRPLDSLDARTRRRIEPNLQPGIVTVVYEGAPAHLFVDGLDFGELPRTRPLHVPVGDRTFEARAADGTVLGSSAASLTMEAPSAEVQLARAVVTVEPDPDPGPGTLPPATGDTGGSSRFDFLPLIITSAAVAVVGVGLGIGFLVAADERARTYNSLCLTPPIDMQGCNAVLSERESFLGAAVFGWVLGGLGAAALITFLVLDSSQPRDRVRVAFSPTGVSVSGTF
jgi:hypothetical protein